MLFSLLDGASSPQWVSYVLIGVLVVILVVSMVVMNRRSKKREAEDKARRDSVGPGNKVTTIGGVCGIVVSVDPEEDTFVLETGSEESGKCYMKFVRQAILESDAFADEKKGKSEESADKQSEAPAKEESAAENAADSAVAESESAKADDAEKADGDASDK